jgi:DNA-binding transcriptional regulator YiaG
MKPEPLKSRTKAEHTQQQAAELLGVPVRTWQDWEHGRSTISPQLLRLYRHLAGIERIPFRSAS